jgi:hypothetical protein
MLVLTVPAMKPMPAKPRIIIADVDGRAQPRARAKRRRRQRVLGPMEVPEISLVVLMTHLAVDQHGSTDR